MTPRRQDKVLHYCGGKRTLDNRYRACQKKNGGVRGRDLRLERPELPELLKLLKLLMMLKLIKVHKLLKLLKLLMMLKLIKVHKLLKLLKVRNRFMDDVYSQFWFLCFLVRHSA
jgi:hypothetical protein